MRLLKRLSEIDAERSRLACLHGVEGSHVTEEGAENGAGTRGEGENGVNRDADLKNTNATPAEGDNNLRSARSLRERRVRTPSIHARALPGEPSGRVEPERLPYASSKRYQFCLRLVKDFERLKDAQPFRVPILELWAKDSLPGYFDIVQKPMDLRTIRENLTRGIYTRPGVETPQFDSERYAFDFRLVFRNAVSYNKPGDLVHGIAENLLSRFESRFRELPIEEPSPDVAHSPGGSDDVIILSQTLAGGKTVSEGSGSKPNRGLSKKKSGIRASPKAASKAARSPSDRKRAAPAPGSSPYEHFNKMTLAEALRKMASLQRQRTALASSNNGRITEQSALYHVNLTYDEKRRLGENIGKLRDEQIVKLLDIVRKRSSEKGAISSQQEEVELDIDSLETGVLREMEAYVNSCLFKKKHGAGSAKARSNAVTAEEVDKQVVALESVIHTLRAAEAAAQNGATAASNPYESESSDNSSDNDSSDASSAA